MQNVLQVSLVHYGQLLLLIGIAYLAATYINSHTLKYFSVDSLIIFGTTMLILSSLALLGSGFFNWLSPLSVILFTSAVIFSTGFIFPNAFAKALEILGLPDFVWKLRKLSN